MNKYIEKYRLIKLLKSLNKAERSSFSRFLDSPYHNRRDDVKGLYKVLQIYLDQSKPMDRGKLWFELYPIDAFNEQQLRLLMSYLTKLFEQFITVEASLKIPFKRKMELVRHLGQRSDFQLKGIYLKEAKKALEKQPFRQAEYLFQTYEYKVEVARLSAAFHPSLRHFFSTTEQAFEQAFEQAILAIKMRQKAWSLNWKEVYHQKEKTNLLDNFINNLTIEDLGDNPAIQIYWYAANFLEDPEKEHYFKQFKLLLFNNSHIFPRNEAGDLYLLAINFGIRKLNEGQQSFFYDVMDLYKEGLRQKYLLKKGILSRFTYHNIVAVALHIGETVWAKSFLEEWTIKLERRFRDRMYHFSSAKIAYATQQFDDALSLLQQSNYHDPLLNLGARTLLVKIYFEQAKWDALDSHLDAFQSYLRRKPDLGYHRTNYRNFIRLTRKILNTNLHDSTKITQLKEQIKEEELLTEKDWLLGRL